MRKHTKTILGVLVSVAAVFAILHNINLADVAHATAGTSGSLVFAGVLSVGMGYVIRSFRWWRMLRLKNHSISLGTSAGVLMASFAANNVLPLRAGDALRVFGFRTVLRLPSTFVLATVVLERLLDLLSLLLLGLCFIRTGGLTAMPVQMVRLVQVLSLGGMALLIAILVFSKQLKICSLWLLGRCVPQTDRRDKTELAIRNVAGLFESISLLEAGHLALLSAAAWMFEAVLYVCVARAMHLHVSVSWLAMALLAANLSAIVPSSPGYVGTFHAAILAMLLLAGVERNAATAYAVVVHAVLWAGITFAGGVAYLLLRGKAAQPVQDSTGEIV
jgi:hypothetical protein